MFFKRTTFKYSRRLLFHNATIIYFRRLFFIKPHFLSYANFPCFPCFLVPLCRVVLGKHSYPSCLAWTVLAGQQEHKGCDPNGDANSSLKKDLKKVRQKIPQNMHLFWTRLTHLPLLQESQTWSRLKKYFKPGDVVLVEGSSPRNTLLMGRIRIQTIPDSSGMVHRVKPQTNDRSYWRVPIYITKGSLQPDHWFC